MERFLKETILKAGSLALDFFRTGVTARTKSNLGDLVTEADDSVSDLIIKYIQAASLITKYTPKKEPSELTREPIMSG
jgi:fructose-1,6-bisphosphatase/inositol monophosphatase family enzyme